GGFFAAGGFKGHHQLGVEVFDGVDGQGFWGGGDFDCAEFGGAVVGEDDVLEDVDEGLGDFFAEDLFGDFAFFFDPDGGFDDVADELAAVAVAEGAGVSELPGFGDVVQEDSGDDQVAIQFRIELADGVGDFDGVEGVLEEAAAE